MPSLRILNERLAALESAAQKRGPPRIDMRALTLPERDFLHACGHDRELPSLTPKGDFKFRHTSIFIQYMKLFMRCRLFPRNTPKEFIESQNNQSYLHDTLEEYFLQISENDKSLPGGLFSLRNLRAHVYIHLRSLCEKYGFDIQTGNIKNMLPPSNWSEKDYCTLCGILMLSLPTYSQIMDENRDFIKMKETTQQVLNQLYMSSK